MKGEEGGFYAWNFDDKDYIRIGNFYEWERENNKFKIKRYYFDLLFNNREFLNDLVDFNHNYLIAVVNNSQIAKLPLPSSIRHIKVGELIEEELDFDIAEIREITDEDKFILDYDWEDAFPWEEQVEWVDW